MYSLWAKNNAAGNVGTASKHEAEAGNPVARSDADELRKYKSLLDDGVITQEEYDKKKREILKL